MKKTWGKRLLSSVTSAVLAVSYMLPSGLQLGGGLLTNAAESILPISGNEAFKTDDVTLLVGDKGMKGKNISETIRNYDNAYALGIASQFCAFIEGDYSPSDSDTEGRLAIGGSLKPTCKWEWDENGTHVVDTFYEVGNGDYEYKQYPGQYNDEYVRLGLDVVLDNSNYATIIVNGDLAENFELDSKDANYIQPDGQEGRTNKRFVIGENTEIGATQSKSEATVENVIYRSDDILDVKAYFSTIKGRSMKLASKEDSGAISYTDGGKTLNLTCKDAVPGDTVYFNLDSWDEGLNSINIDVKEGVYVVINCNDENVKITSTCNEYANHFKTVYAGKRIDKGADINKNNDPDSAYILYNFPNAKTIEFSVCFNGTILAPNAAFVGKPDSHNYNAHLSGSLIAASFEGSAEIGFRPFTGPISMLGMDSAYSVDLYKYIKGTTDLLDGATVGLFPVADDGTVSETPSSEFVIENGHINQAIEPGRYVLKETKAPEGYTIDTTQEYYIDVKAGDKVEKSDIKTGGTITDTKPVIYEIDKDITQDVVTGEASPYVPAEKQQYQYTYTLNYSDFGKYLNKLAWNAQAPTGLKIDQVVLNYADTKPDVYVIGEDGFELTEDTKDQYTPAEEQKKQYVYTITFDSPKSFSQMAWNTAAPAIDVDKLVFYHEDGSAETVDTVNWSTGSNDWNQFNINVNNKENITKIEMVMSGNVEAEQDKLKLIVQDSSYSNIFSGSFTANDCTLEYPLITKYYKLADEDNLPEGKISAEVTVDGITSKVEAVLIDQKSPKYLGIDADYNIVGVKWNTVTDNWHEFELDLTEEEKQDVVSVEIALSGRVEENASNLKICAQDEKYINQTETIDINDEASVDKIEILIKKYYKKWVESESPSGSTTEGDVTTTKTYTTVTVNGEEIVVEAIKTESPEYLNTFEYTDGVTITLYEDSKFENVKETASYSPLNVEEATYELDGNTLKFTINEEGAVTDVEVLNGDGSYSAEDFSAYSVDSDKSHYVIVYNGDVLNAKINLTQKLATQLKFEN